MSQVIYALDTFEATQDGQLTVAKNDQLFLLNDDHYYWWYVQECQSNVMGFVPAELLELPNERLARQNSLRNQKVDGDAANKSTQYTNDQDVDEEQAKSRMNRQRSVRFTPAIDDVPDLSTDCSSESDSSLAVELMLEEVLPRQSSMGIYDNVPGMMENIQRMDQLEKRLQEIITSI